MAEIPERWQTIYEQVRQAAIASTAANSLSPNAVVQVLIGELATAEARIRELELEIKSGDEMYEAQQQKFDGCPHKPIGPGYNACGCSHDKIGDVCGLHSPALRAAQTRVRELEQERERLFDQIKNAEAHEKALRDADKTLAPCNCLCDVTKTREIIRAALAYKPQEEEVKP